MTDEQLAKHLARKIFEIGDEQRESGGSTQRIQFMGGTWPDREVPMGGMCEQALAENISRILDEHAANKAVRRSMREAGLRVAR